MRHFFIILLLIWIPSLGNAGHTSKYRKPDNFSALLDSAIIQNDDSQETLPLHKLNHFEEVIRRLPENHQSQIRSKLDSINLSDLAPIQFLLFHPRAILLKNSPLKDPSFAFWALRALQLEQITAHQFGTLMLLHSIRLKEKEIRLVPLYNSAGHKNSEASKVMLASTNYSHLVNLRAFSLLLDPKKIQKIYEWMEEDHSEIPGKIIPPLEKHLFLIPQGQDSYSESTSLNTPPIHEAIWNLGFSVFSLFRVKNHESFDIVPTFSLMRAYLETTFKSQAVQLNVVIGISKLKDLWMGALQGYRDIAVPFPEAPLPKTTDGYPVPEEYHFTHHDFYHSIRLSITPPIERKIIIKLGNEMRDIQNSYRETIQRHTEKIKKLENKKNDIELSSRSSFVSLLGEFDPTHPPHFVEVLTEQIHSENRKGVILNKHLKTLGLMKFICWDSENRLSHPPLTSPIQALQKYHRKISLTEKEFQYIVTERENWFARYSNPVPADQIETE